MLKSSASVRIMVLKKVCTIVETRSWNAGVSHPDNNSNIRFVGTVVVVESGVGVGGGGRSERARYRM